MLLVPPGLIPLVVRGWNYLVYFLSNFLPKGTQLAKCQFIFNYWDYEDQKEQPTSTNKEELASCIVVNNSLTLVA